MYRLNDINLMPGEPFAVGDTHYSGAEISLWSRVDLEALGLVWVEPATATLEQRLAELADLRWRKTQTMPAYDGAVDVPAETARSVVTSKILAAQFMTPEQQLETSSFKLREGEWRQWALADIVAYGLAIGAYVQACFDHERTLSLALAEAADPTTIDIMAGWP